MSKKRERPPWEDDPDYNLRQDRENAIRYAAEEEEILNSPQSMRERLTELEGQVAKLTAVIKLLAVRPT